MSLKNNLPLQTFVTTLTRPSYYSCFGASAIPAFKFIV